MGRGTDSDGIVERGRFLDGELQEGYRTNYFEAGRIWLVKQGVALEEPAWIYAKGFQEGDVLNSTEGAFLAKVVGGKVLGRPGGSGELTELEYYHEPSDIEATLNGPGPVETGTYRKNTAYRRLDPDDPRAVTVRAKASRLRADAARCLAEEASKRRAAAARKLEEARQKMAAIERRFKEGWKAVTTRPPGNWVPVSELSTGKQVWIEGKLRTLKTVSNVIEPRMVGNYFPYPLQGIHGWRIAFADRLCTDYECFKRNSGEPELLLHKISEDALFRTFRLIRASDGRGHFEIFRPYTTDALYARAKAADLRLLEQERKWKTDLQNRENFIWQHENKDRLEREAKEAKAAADIAKWDKIHAQHNRRDRFSLRGMIAGAASSNHQSSGRTRRSGGGTASPSYRSGSSSPASKVCGGMGCWSSGWEAQDRVANPVKYFQNDY